MSTIIFTILFIIIASLILKKIFQGGTNSLKTDMTDKVIIITGASTGLGFYHAKNLIESSATVIFACRTESKAKKAISSLPIEKQTKAIYMPLDLCSFESIKNFAKAIIEKYPKKIDILVNNAGAFPTKFIETKDKLESFLEGNHLGPMYLTLLLIDNIKPNGKIINLSSIAHFWSSLNENSVEILSDIQKVKDNYFKSFAGKGYLYNDTKLMNLYFTSYMNEVFEKRNIPIKTCCVHPGGCNTEFLRYLNELGILGTIINILLQPLIFIFFKSAEQGAQTQIYLSHLDYDKLKGGAYFADCKIHEKSKKGENINIRNEIINWSLKEIKKREDISFQI